MSGGGSFEPPVHFFASLNCAEGEKCKAAPHKLVALDINGDGWTDVFISNDYFKADHLYINQKDGTFLEKALSNMDHMSNFSMGTDIAQGVEIAVDVEDVAIGVASQRGDDRHYITV